MSKFRFLHAADLHLDSPLIGLTRKSADYAERVDDASRRAFDNLITLARDEECSFVVIAGDVFDGQWRDYHTGLFFADRMRRLKDAGIRVFMILGNHDAENKFASRLELSDNVHLFSRRRPESVTIDTLEATIHGQSFPQRDVVENMALDYPQPVGGHFNIGILHTACNGHPEHAPYAPCNIEQLVNHGYAYWALGHVHAREQLNAEPHIVYPGNLQGRHVRETGAKGAALVSVEDGHVVGIEHRPLDVIRWQILDIDIGAATEKTVVLGMLRERLEDAHATAEGRGLAVRLRLSGDTILTYELTAGRGALREEIETIALNVSGELWIEKLELRIQTPLRSDVTDPTIAGKIIRAVEQLRNDQLFAQTLEARVAEIKAKTPAGAQMDDFFATIGAEAPKRAIDRALALVDRREE